MISCPHCGSDDVEPADGVSYFCNECETLFDAPDEEFE